jgi:hypothetical protein
MICFILVLIDLVCSAFGVRFAQDTVQLATAAFLEAMAEILLCGLYLAISEFKKDTK